MKKKQKSFDKAASRAKDERKGAKRPRAFGRSEGTPLVPKGNAAKLRIEAKGEFQKPCNRMPWDKLQKFIENRTADESRGTDSTANKLDISVLSDTETPRCEVSQLQINFPVSWEELIQKKDASDK